MRILVLSDLHLELWRNAPKPKELLEGLQTNLDACRPDLVILAGDIDVGDSGDMGASVLPTLPVIYVHGNHEGYGQKIDTLKEKLAVACSETGHIHFLYKGRWSWAASDFSAQRCGRTFSFSAQIASKRPCNRRPSG